MTTWLTVEAFKRGVRLDGTYGSGGFGVLLAAARAASEDAAREEIGKFWDPDDLSPWAIEEGERAAAEENAPFLAWITAAALHADLENRRKIDSLLPGFTREVITRYNTGAGLIPGEVAEIGGTLYLCAGGVTEREYGLFVETKVERVFA